MSRSPFPILFLDLDDVVVLSRPVGFDKHRVHELAEALCREMIHPPAAQALLELLDECQARVVSKRGPSTLLTGAATQMSTTCRSRPKPTRQVWPLPVSIVAVRWLMRVMVPTCVFR